MTAETRDGRTWAVVLAGGDGVRVREVIRRMYGLAQPKQFCAFGGSRSLLRQTLERAERLVPRERVVVVVCEAHRPWWEKELTTLPAANVVVQPSNRGTAAGVLAGLFQVLGRARQPARLVFLPSDHRVGDEDRLEAALEGALEEANGGRLVLLGMRAVRAEQGYGWIVPSSRGGGASRPVERFLEKPPPRTARQILAEGALVNSFTFAAASETLVRLYARTAFDLLFSFMASRDLRDPTSTRWMLDLYEELEVWDLSHDVLERAPEELAVLRVDDCGWADLGTPDRLERHLADRPRPPSLGRPLEQSP
jgi:mannose-1-phosphate guanylyltransferase